MSLKVFCSVLLRGLMSLKVFFSVLLKRLMSLKVFFSVLIARTLALRQGLKPLPDGWTAGKKSGF
jgi:hypothetical protein